MKKNWILSLYKCGGIKGKPLLSPRMSSMLCLMQEIFDGPFSDKRFKFDLKFSTDLEKLLKFTFI